MQGNTDVFTELKRFLDFGDQDAENLRLLAPVFATHGAAITDAFYEKLAGVPETARLIEGRVSALKATHARWMGELFAGDYGPAYFDNRWKIGLAHVRVNVPTQYVEAVVSFLRTETELLLSKAFASSREAEEHHVSLVKILDLDLMIINLAYSAERIQRLSKFTGMSQKLLERCIQKGY